MSLHRHLRGRVATSALASLVALSAAAALAPLASADRGPDFGDFHDFHDGGQVLTETNAVAGNAVLSFDRAPDGRLIPTGSFPTGGTGTGAGLGSQGPVAVDDGAVYAVDAGSGDVATLRTSRRGLRVIDREPAGTTPVSITVHDSLAFVLDAAGTGQILGFRVQPGGGLRPIFGSARPLSDGAAGAAEVAFSPDGRTLVVTERGTSRIDTYRVRPNGRIEGPVVNASLGAVPFGFAFDRAGRLIVSEAGASTASSYGLADSGAITPISASIPTLQGAACWVAITPNGRFAYTGNGGGSVTGFALAPNGSLTRLLSDGLSAVSPRANEVAITPDGRDLYVVSPALGTITAFAIGRDGALTPLPAVTGLPAGLAGLVAS